MTTTLASRSPRIRVELPIRFFSSEGTRSGISVDVSRSGLLGTFDRPPNLFTTGELTASLGDRYVSIKARVVRVDGLHTGLSFRITSEFERAAIHQLIDFARKHAQSVAAKRSAKAPDSAKSA